MDTVAQIITHVSAQLNDQRQNRAFIRWGRGLLLEYLNLGLIEIGIYKLDAFTQTVNIPLVSGDMQTVPDGMTLLSIDANADGSRISPANSDLVSSFSSYAVCPPKIKFKNGAPVLKIQTASVDKFNPKVFYVQPPVPQGVQMTVRATVVDAPPQYTLNDWGKPVKMEVKYTNSLIDWMMAKAYELNREVSAQDRANCTQYYNKFYQGLGVKRKLEDKFRAGYVNGQTGTGDPRTANT